MGWKVVKTLFDYTANNDEELNFTADSILYIIDDQDPSWWLAKDKDGQTGYIPTNYVDQVLIIFFFFF